MENKIVLSPKKILNKQFQVDFKGYNADEVDYFLDVVSNDYSNFAAMLNESYEEIENLQREIQVLKSRLTAMESEEKVETKAAESNINSNVDLLRRLSQLEKEVYNKKED